MKKNNVKVKVWGIEEIKIDSEGEVLIGAIAKANKTTEKEETVKGYNVSGILLGEAPKDLVIDMAVELSANAITKSSNEPIEVIINVEKFIDKLSKRLISKREEWDKNSVLKK